jgi:hypothetical protein
MGDPFRHGWPPNMYRLFVSKKARLLTSQKDWLQYDYIISRENNSLLHMRRECEQKIR